MSAERSDPAAPTSGTIHDIGYRHYDGPRLGRAYARASLLLDTLRAAYGFGRTTRSKVAPLLLLGLVCLPALVWVVVGAVLKTGHLPVGFLEFLTVIQPMVSIYAAVLAPAAVSRDLRFGTLALYRSRPLSSSDYVLAKLLAAATALFIFMLTPLAILYFGGMLAEIPAGRELGDFLRGALAAALLATWLASFSLLVAALTPRRGVGIAAIVTILLVLAGTQVFTMGFSDDEGMRTLATWSRVLSPYTLVDGIVAGALDGDSPIPYLPDGVAELAGFAAVYLAAVATFISALIARYRRGSVA